MFAPFFFQGGEVPPTPRDIIGKSLRFRGAQTLQRTGVDTNTGSTSGTFSVWYKIGYDTDSGALVSIFNSPQNASNQLNPTVKDQPFRVPSASLAHIALTHQFVDPEAWYHCVANYDETTSYLYINGRLVGTEPTDQPQSMRAGDQFIGSAGTVQFFEGYLADFYAIEGRRLPPTEFGKYDDNGVWVPIINDSLKAPGGVYSNFLTAAGGFVPDGTSTTAGGPGYAFDGNLTLRATTNDGNALVTFAPASAIPYTTSVEVMVRSNSVATLNGGADVNTNAGESDEWTTLATGSGVINTITAQATNGSTTAVYAFRVDGEILIDSTLWSTQCFTSAATATPDLTSTEQNWEAGFPITNGFDGSLTTVAAPTTPGGWSIFRPNTALTGVTTLLVESQQVEAIWINGNSVVVPTPGGTNGRTYDLTSVIPANGTIENLSVKSNAGQQFAWYGITINGQILVDGVSYGYGPNGFHLQFADPYNIGLDTSGNGNDFTASGFDFSPVGIFSDLIQGSGGTYEVDQANRTAPIINRTLTFDGPADGGSQVDSTPVGWWYLPRPFSNVRSIAVDLWFSNATGALRINGEEVTYTRQVLSNANLSRLTVTNPPADVSEIACIANQPNTQPTQILINDIVLTDNEGGDYDSMQDSPTQNYSTLNPLPKGVNLAGFDNANLEAHSTSDQYTPVFSTFCMPRSGKWYAERIISAFSGIGVELASDIGTNIPSTTTAGLNPSVVFRALGNAGAGIALDGSTNAGGTLPSAFQTAAQGKTARIMFDLDASPPTLTVEIDGTSASANFTSGLTSADEDYVVYLMFNAVGTQDSNFGQRPFVFGPPSGFSPLQTQNLPEATIPDGREYFRAILGSGQVGGLMYCEIYSDEPNPGTVTTTPLSFPLTSPNITASGSSTMNPENGGAWQYVVDLGLVVDSVQLTWEYQAGTQTFIYSLDGQTWFGSEQSNGATSMTASPGSPFRYIRRYTSSAGRQRYTADKGASILSTAQSTFPKGLYWIKDLENANQWQFVSFMTGLGSTAYNTTGQANPTYPFSQGFDGDASTATYADYNTTNIITFPTPITGTTYTIKAFCPMGTFKVNGTLIPNQSGSTTVYDISALANGSLSSLEYTGGNPTTEGFYIITVDGQPVIGEGQGQALQCPAAGALTTYVPPTGNSIAYCWNSVNDADVNTNGTTPSQVSADPKSGFSVLTYNGTNTPNTIGHGLDKAPEFIIIKSTTTGENWRVYSSVTGPGEYLALNSTSAAISNTEIWNNTAPTNTVFSVGAGQQVNSANSYVAYCWTTIPGFSAVGSFKGNNSTDGPFIYTGFETAFVMIKRLNNDDHWTVRSVGIEPAFNPMSYELNPDMTNAAQTTSNVTDVDFLSNGFKIRSNDSRLNGNNEDYLYFAFASNPFGGNNINPVTAY